MRMITKPQIQKIHVLLRQQGIGDTEKREIVYRLTNGRTESSRDLTGHEAHILIEYLQGNDPTDRMRAKVFALAYEAGIIYGDTPEDKKINAAKINLFLQRSGSVKKPLKQQTYKELLKTLAQMEAIVKHTSESQAKKATDILLQELSISKPIK